MKTRLVGGAMALGIAVGLVGVAVVAASGGWGSDDPRRLAVLGQPGAGARSETAMAADSSVAAGGTVYRLGEGVEAPVDEARAWSVGIGDAVEERVRELASALGITGDVVEEEFAWSVTEGDRRLEVQRQPGLPWSYLPTGGRASGSSGGGSEPSTAADAPVSSDAAAAEASRAAEERAVAACAMPECPPGTVCAAVCPEVDPAVPCEGPASSCLAPDGGPEPQRPADLPTAGEAEARGRELLAAAGLDLEGAAVRVDDGFTAWYVSVDPTLDGVPTVGMSWGVAVGAGGAVESANGWLTDPRRGDAYPLLDLAAAVERLEGMAFTLEMRAECPAGETCPEPETVELTVTGARLGLQLVSSFEADEAFLVPSYLLEIEGGGRDSEIPVFAVADEYLTTPPAAEPVPLPEPVPVETPPAAEEPPDVGPAQPPATAEPPAIGPGAGCVTGTGAPGQAAPLEVEVCATAGTAGVAPVVLTVRATDADARVRDDCGSPVVSWGDGEPTAVCDIGVGCAADEPARPLDTVLEHIYAAPGTYEIEVTAESVCDDPASGSVTVSVPVVVSP